MKTIGFDVGSTTLKCVVLDENENIVYKDYQRHRSKAGELCAEFLRTIAGRFPGEKFEIAMSGSAGMGLAEQLGLPFSQEVFATRIAARRLAP